MELKQKYVIGTQVMFYEIEILPEFINSIVQAVRTVDNPKNVTVDLVFNMSEYFEKIDTSKITEKDLRYKFYKQLELLEKTGITVNASVYNGKSPFTMTNYRRDFNYKYCNTHDYLIWGETDCLIPVETFISLEQVKDYANSQNIHRFITTFGVRKMWDTSWEVLEHPFVNGKKYLEKTDDGCFTEPHSIRYTMSQHEMEEINSKTDSIDLRILTQPKFDGSCLVISSDLIKAGANIPPGFFGLSAEDTVFMYSCMQIMGAAYVQFVIKNILKVHNREHPQKRNYAKDMLTDDTSTQAKKGSWYNTLRDINKENLNYFIGHRQEKFLSWDDYKQKLKEQ